MNTQTQTNPNGVNLNATHFNPTLIPTALPSMNMNHIQFIRELREAIKNWEAKVPPNSYVDYPGNLFRVHKDFKGATRIITPNRGQNQVTDLDRFCDLIRRQNITTSVTAAVPANSQAGSSSMSNAQKAVPSTVNKATPSTVHKANVRTTSSFSQSQSATFHRPEYPRPGASSSKQTPPTMSTSIHNQGTASLNHQTATPSTSRQTGSSTSHLQLFTPSMFVSQPSPLIPPLPPSTVQTPSSISFPKTPSRQLSTTVNGVSRSAKQADKKFLASHLLFGLGKRQREPDTSLTALTEPQPKRRDQQGAAQVEAGVIPFTSYTLSQAIQTVHKPNVPVQLQITPSTASSSLKQPLDPLPMIPQETQQISQTLSSDDRGQLANAALETPSTSKVAAAVEVLEASEIFSDQPPLSSQDSRNVIPSAEHQKNILDDRPAGYSVLLTTSTGVPTSTLPPPVPLAVQDAVSSEISSGVNEDTTQPIVSVVPRRLQPNAPANLQHSFADVSTPFGTSAPIFQTKQPLFLPSPVSSPGIDVNDDDKISRSGRHSVDVASRSFDLRKSSSSTKRKNHAYVLVPPRPQYLVKYLELKISRASLKKRMTSRTSVSTSGAEEEGV
jgi:hypothetical protein